MKRFYHYFLFSDPEGSQTPHAFCDKLLKPYGSTRMPALFHNSIFPSNGSGGYDSTGPIDENKFRRILARGDNTGAIPKNSRCWLNIEGSTHRICQPLPESPWYIFQQEELDWFHDVLGVAKSERPDVKFGFYGQVPFAGIDFICNPGLEGRREQILVACHSLAKEVDFLLPYFYDRLNLPPLFNTFDQRLKWIETTLDSCRRFYPGVTVIGMPWCEYYDLWQSHPLPDTHEAQVARRLSGYTWLKYNQLILELADGVLWWGGASRDNGPGTSFDYTAEWWDVSKRDIFGVYGKQPRGGE